jgi:hypothetical protein
MGSTTTVFKNAAIVAASIALIAQGDLPNFTSRHLIDMATAELGRQDYEIDRYSRITSSCQSDTCTVSFADFSSINVDDLTFVHVTFNKRTNEVTVLTGLIND